MHATMYADMFAWRGTLLIVLLVAVGLIIRSVLVKEELRPKEKEESRKEGKEWQA